jgi:hypothetical protein
VKDTVYVPPLPRNLQELQNIIVAALGEVTSATNRMLKCNKVNAAYKRKLHQNI